MKARLVPLYFDPGRDATSTSSWTRSDRCWRSEAEFLEPLPLGAPLPEAEAVVFPQLWARPTARCDAFRAIDVPILLVTTEFGTLSMWDWEIAEYLKSHGVETIAPYNLEQTQKCVPHLAVKRELRETKFLVYQDDPGEGFQARFSNGSTGGRTSAAQRLHDKFGITIVKKSFRELGAAAKAISDTEADETRRTGNVPTSGLVDQAFRSAVKLYLAVKRDLDADQTIRAAGINCLNESHFSRHHALPGLEPALSGARIDLGLRSRHDGDDHEVPASQVARRADHDDQSLSVPAGQRRLEARTDREFSGGGVEPENHILVAHCGYMGVIPQPFATEWTLRKKVLAIVDDNASAIDARLPDRRHHAGQTASVDGQDDRGRRDADRLRAVSRLRLPQRRRGQRFEMAAD